MRQFSFAVAFTLGLSGASFAGDQVTTETAQDANFAPCTSYQWATTGQEAQNPIQAQNITSFIDTQLGAKGWTKSPTGACYVSYQVAEQQQRGANWSGMGGFGRFGGGMGSIQSYTIEQGELIVNVFSPQKKMMWMGSAKGTIDSNPQKETKSLENDIKKMFQKFPTGK
jgi:hypothetical protein